MGLGTKPQARKRPCSQVPTCRSSDAESVIIVLCSWSSCKSTSGTLDLQHPCRGLYITCTRRMAATLKGMPSPGHTLSAVGRTSAIAILAVLLAWVAPLWACVALICPLLLMEHPETLTGNKELLISNLGCCKLCV